MSDFLSVSNWDIWQNGKWFKIKQELAKQQMMYRLTDFSYWNSRPMKKMAKSKSVQIAFKIKMSSVTVSSVNIFVHVTI